MSDDSAHISRVVAVEEHVWTPRLRAALLSFGSDETVTMYSNQQDTPITSC